MRAGVCVDGCVRMCLCANDDDSRRVRAHSQASVYVCVCVCVHVIGSRRCIGCLDCQFFFLWKTRRTICVDLCCKEDLCDVTDCSAHFLIHISVT